MALYKNGSYLQKSDDAAFDVDYTPGQQPAHSGIFRCMGCGREVVGEHTRTLPPQNHHQHNVQQQGAVRWRMIVYPDGSEK
jgi:hypothetical protein